MYPSYVGGGDKLKAYIYAYKGKGGSENQRSSSLILNRGPHLFFVQCFPSILPEIIRKPKMPKIDAIQKYQFRTPSRLLLSFIVESIDLLTLFNVGKVLSKIAHGNGAIKIILIKQTTSENRERFSMDRFRD